MKNSLEDLAIVLKSVKIARNRWLKIIKKRITALKMRDPELTHSQALNMALFNSEVNTEFQKLLNLYSIVGQNALEYEQALIQHSLKIDKDAA